MMTSNPSSNDISGTGPIGNTGDERDQKLLTISEAAHILRAPIATLRYWRHLGTGPHSFRIGRRVLYRHTDLITWINDHHDHNGPHAA